MTELVKQPSAINPTRKLSAAVVAVAVMELLWVVLSNVAPSWADPSLKASLTPVVVFIVGYFVHDAPNVDMSGPPYDGTEHA